MSEEDHSIIERIIAGDRDSFALIVHKYNAPVFNLAFRMTGSYEEAGDLAQETFVKAFENLGRFDRKRRFFTWLYTIGLNLIRNHLKKKKNYVTNRVRGADYHSQSSPPDPEQDMIQQEEVLRISSCLDRLPVKLKEAVVLRFYQDLSFDEIAEITACSVGSAKMRVYRGLEGLNRMMNEK